MNESSNNTPSNEPPEEVVRVRVDGACGTIVLNQAERRNALSRRMLSDLKQAFADLHGERQVRAVLITGSQDSFCSGSDLIEIRDTISDDDAQATWFSDVNAVRTLYETMLQFPKPIISAVNGPALGTGFGIVLASDIVVSCKEAQYGLPEPRRGLVAGIVAPLLAFRIGGGNAAQLLLRGTTIDHAAALEKGLVHESVPLDLLWAKGNEISVEIAQASAVSVAMTKRVLYEGAGEALSKMMSTGAAATATARTTEDAAEGVTAFLEKREPNWP